MDSITACFFEVDIDLENIKTNFPQKSIFENVFVSTQTYDVFGYFLNLSENPNALDNLIELCTSERWQQIDEIDAKYILYVFNKKTKKVHVLTDTITTFPIYWTIQKNKCIISPNIDYLVSLQQDIEVDLHQVTELIAFEGNITHYTIFSNINKLPSGCYLTIDSNLSWNIQSYL